MPMPIKVYAAAEFNWAENKKVTVVIFDDW